ncbi:MAG TPA: mechanosensitive ion channel domain-containing protein [Arenimonas sp.]|nr:mechanosensitive ion channel domain-containing protein [Arenimonas sp.]
MSFASILSRCLLTLLLASGAAHAQIPGLPKAAEPVAETPVVPATVPIADIPRQIENDQRLVQDMMQHSTGVSGRSARANELATLKANADALVRKTSPSQLEGIPLSGLTALERHLRFVALELSRWQKDLQSAARPLSEDAAALAQKRELWLATRQLSGELLVPAMQRSIDELLAEFDQTERAVSVPLSQVLDLGRDAGLLQSRVDKGLANVQDRISQIDRGLWRVDSENLFAAYAHNAKQPKEGTETLTNGLKAELAFIKAYDDVSRDKNNLYMFISLLFLPLLLWLARQARALLSSDARLEDYRKTLTRPISAWLLLSIMGLLLLQINGPVLRLKFLLIIAWLPVMRLQPKRLLDSVGNWMYATALFFLINLFAQMVSNLSWIFRILVLVNDFLMLATLLWLLYRIAQRIKTGSTRLLRVMRGLSAAGAAVMVTAIVANVIGNVTLAAMLTDATLNSAYLGLFLYAVSTVIRAFTRFLLRSTVEKLKSQTQHAGGLMEVVSRLFNLVLVLTWAYGSLYSFRILLPLIAAMKSLTSFEIGYGSVSITLGGILLFFVTVYLSFWVAKTIRGVLSEDVLSNMDLPRGVANSVSTLSYYTLLLLGLVFALSAAGFQMSQLTLVLGALSVGIGFGLNTVINNFVSGLILMVERPVQPGDTIELSGTVGRVREIGMRATTLTTFEGADVIVPNGMLLSEKMINWTLSSDKRRIDIPVGVAYGSDPNKVLALLAQVADSAPGVSKNPAPTVLFTGFGPNALEFSVRAWTDNFDDSVFVRSGMAVGIHDALLQAGIEIPFPQRDLHLKSVDAEILSQLKRGDT